MVAKTPAPLCLLLPLTLVIPVFAGETVVVDTGQALCYDDVGAITPPAPGASWYGQDAQHDGPQPSYQDHLDGTVTDLNTGLMWQQSPDFSTKRTWTECVAYADALVLGGHQDWRMPSVKELYSLMDFGGSSVSGEFYIDTTYFDFQYAPASTGDRPIDVQMFTSTEYVGLTMSGNPTVFGVNFADGRIKGYPKDTAPNGNTFERYVRCVRGGDDYGVNDYVDNGDGTITDRATGLMWMQGDAGSALSWEDALAYAESSSHANHTDWRLPNAKELQSIVDYTRAPDATDPTRQAPAIDPIFSMPDPEAWYWTGTTLLESGPGQTKHSVYVCFGLATGWMQQPPFSGNYVLMNVHGAGAQRSDPKSGDPAAYPYGHGPQGDVIRILNHVRCVRDAPACDAGSGVHFCPGDANCPCGNDNADCGGCLNSSGEGARLVASGTPSVSADSLVLTVSGAPANEFGIFVQNLATATGTAFYDGLLCLPLDLHTVRHYAPPAILPTLTDATGTGASAQPLTLGDYLGDTQPGVTLHYQFWVRDGAGSCGTGAVISSGVSLSWGL